MEQSYLGPDLLNSGWQDQYGQQPAAGGGYDWADVERQLREYGGGLYHSSDLEGIQRNTSYSEPGKGSTLDQAIQNQMRIYDQRRSSDQAPRPGGGGGGAGSGAGQGPAYTPPPVISSPFIMPNGQIPPGMPFSPNMEMQGLQNQALQTMLSQPMFDENYISRLNEQQKELALARGAATSRGLEQSAISRGTLGGATQGGIRRRQADALTSQLLQSQRDVSNQAVTGNRAALLDALGASDSILSGREGRGLDVARFAELIRQYDNDLRNRQAEFGSGMDFRYADLNSSLEQQFINQILSGGR
jgi:hypothetical protein